MSHERGRRLNWILGVVSVAAIVGTVQGWRIARTAEDASFITVLVLIVLYVVMAWWRFSQGWKDSATTRWKAWVSLAGCVALTLAFVLPCIQVLMAFRPWFGSGWDFKMLMVGLGLFGLVAGVVAAKNAGFPLIVGGFLIALAGVVIPAGV